MLLTMLLAAAQPAAETAPAGQSRMVELIGREGGQHACPMARYALNCRTVPMQVRDRPI